MKAKKGLLIFIQTVIVCVLAIAVVFFVYTGDYYHTVEIEQPDEDVCKVNIIEEKDEIVFEPDDIKCGLVFYPGGKVEFDAYSSLMHALADQGVLCVLLKMPFNLAVFNVDACNGVLDKYPQVTKWYMAGHSLGGSMAGTYLSKNTENFAGLILLASYTTEDLSQTNLKVLSIYGSNDGVMNRDNYEKYKSNLPSDYKEYIIDGGCHSYFGAYGMQKNDGNPTITQNEQIKETVDFIINNI